jgi:hypothetical protein
MLQRIVTGHRMEPASPSIAGRAVASDRPGAAVGRGRLPVAALATAVPALLLAAQLLLIAWLAPRGLDLTDESYALVLLSHWRDLTAGTSLFATFLGPVLAAVDRSVFAIRLLGTLALVAASGWACWSLLRLYRRLVGSDAPIAPGFVVAGMAAGLLHYSFTATLRVPSYNLLVLVAMTCATALLCGVLEPGSAVRRKCVAAFGYGVFAVVAGLTKATSGLAMLLCHGLVLLLLWPGLGRRQALALFAAAAAGGAAVLGAVHWAQPTWWTIVRDGAALGRMLDGRSLATVMEGLHRDLVQSLARMGLDQVALTLMLVALALLLAVRWRRAVAWIVGTAIALAVLGSLVRGYGKMWWAFDAVALCLCAAILWKCASPSLDRREVRIAGTLGAMLMALPVAFSLGTNGSLPAHTQMASSFAAIALLLVVWRLASVGLLHHAGVAGCLAIVAGAGLWVQWPALHDANAAYRLGAGLLEQTEPVTAGSGRTTILVDPAMKRDIGALRAAARSAGFEPGTTLIDLTGDGPGWVYLLDARPPGVPWIIGGYAGSAVVAEALLKRLPADRLRGSWVLTADRNPRSIAESPDWLHRIDPSLRHRQVAAVTVQRRYSFSPVVDPAPLKLLLWKPVREGGG